MPSSQALGVSSRQWESRPEELPRWIWLGIPIGFLMFQAAIGASDEQLYRRWFVGETGLVENLTVLVLGAGVFWGCRAYSAASVREMAPLRAWLILLSCSCVYFAGEELSWGQHLVGWRTPALWEQINDQQETNLHNTSALFDQWPRTMLTIAALGAAVTPLWSRLAMARQAGLSRLSWYVPTVACVPVCLLAVSLTLPAKLGLPGLVRVNPGELKELYLAGFLSVYLGSVAHWLRSAPALKDSQSSPGPQLRNAA